VKACANACGDCRRCRAVKARLAETARNARLLRQAMTLLDSCRWAIQQELDAAGAEEVRQHPALKPKVGLIYRIEKLTRQVESK